MNATQKILGQMAAIPAMLRGTLSEQRRTKAGRAYYSLQRWVDGRNDARYVPAEKAAYVREQVRNYRRFMRLVEQYIRAAEKKSKF